MMKEVVTGARFMVFGPESEGVAEQPPIEVLTFEPHPEKPGWDRVRGGRPVRDIVPELVERLKADPAVRFEDLDYFHTALEVELAKHPEERVFPYPYSFIACFAVTGASEGHYIHIEATFRDEATKALRLRPLALGKTFHGLEHAYAIATACAKHLGA